LIQILIDKLTSFFTIRPLLIVSAILNSVLISFVVGFWPVLAFLFFSSILFLLWYIRKALERHNDLTEDLEAVMEEVEKFGTHLDSVFQLEMYYGDPTLESLLGHTNTLYNFLVEYVDRYSLDEVDVEEDEIPEEPEVKTIFQVERDNEEN